MTKKLQFLFSLIFIVCMVTELSGQEPEPAKYTFVLFLPVGYNYIRLDEQTVHSPAAGFGFLVGEQDIPFDQVERRFMGLAVYQPYFFSEEPFPEAPKMLHQIGGMFDGRLKRQQLIFIFNAPSDKPVVGGFNTFRIGAGWGYEVIRRPQVSLILGAVVGVNDFGITLPSGSIWPVMPLPMIRFALDTQWFASTFDFITGPNFQFTAAPKARLRLTGDMRLETYDSLAHLDCEFAVWYRLFDTEHRMGDFAGIGLGFKNTLVGFDLSRNVNYVKTFELQHNAVFAAVDISILKLKLVGFMAALTLLISKKKEVPAADFFFRFRE
jgi:hypothetical protein